MMMMMLIMLRRKIIITRIIITIIIVIVSSDSTHASQGDSSSVNEADARITHHIVDRPAVSQRHMNRHYIQPQWVVDCVNARRVGVCFQDFYC
jgi:hypothetical protein